MEPCEWQGRTTVRSASSGATVGLRLLFSARMWIPWWFSASWSLTLSLGLLEGDGLLYEHRVATPSSSTGGVLVVSKDPEPPSLIAPGRRPALFAAVEQRQKSVKITDFVNARRFAPDVTLRDVLACATLRAPDASASVFIILNNLEERLLADLDAPFAQTGPGELHSTETPGKSLAILPASPFAMGVSK
jgi:hypothetical protein